MTRLFAAWRRPDMQDPRTLPADLTIYAVAEWHGRCLAWLGSEDADGPALSLEASAVTEIDAAGVQLLTALFNSLARRDRSLRLDRPSPALQDACKRLGATFLLPEAQEAVE